MVVKYCIVPFCDNNSINSSKKIFIRVPENKKTRQKWFNAINPIRRPAVSSNVFVCEDHFDLENDVENWQKFKLMGYKLKIKNDVVPHNNLDEKKRDETISQVSSSTKKRIDIKESRPSEPATQNATQGNSSHSEQVHIKEEPLEADPSEYRLYQQLRDSIKTEPVNSDIVSNNSDTEKHIHSTFTDKEHIVNVKKEYSDSCENESSVNHDTEQIPMFESVFVKEEPFEEDFPL